VVHLAGYVGLTTIHVASSHVAVTRPPSELQWLTIESATEPVATVPEDPDPPEPAEPEPMRPRRPDPVEELVEPEPQVAAEVPDPIVVPPPTPEPEPEVAEPPPEIPELSMHAVEQRSADPSVEPPPDTQYMAAENQRVEEETVAEASSIRSDEAVATPPPPDGDMSDGDEPTDDPSDEPHEGSPTDSAPVVGTESSAESHGSASTGSSTVSASSAQTASTAAAAPAVPGASAVAPAEVEMVTIDDGFGTFTVERPRAETARVDPREGTAGVTPRTPNLRIGFSALEQIYGHDQLAAERAERRAEREALAASSGNGRRERWQQYQFAAENFLPTVRPGNQTALNAAASPYASWISEVHRRIHQQFADRFLARLSNHDPALSNPDLYTELEFVVDARGRVLRVAITHTSGVSVFDLGAFNSVLDAQPLPDPPEAIYSGDGRVYLIWGFSRGPSACHVMQARPFILPNPPPLVTMPGVVADPVRVPERFQDPESDGPTPGVAGTSSEASDTGTPRSRPPVLGTGPRRRL